MSVTGKAPIREPSPAVAQTDYVERSVVQEQLATQQTLVAYLRIFLENRNFLWRVGAYALALSALIAFLIPIRYQSLTRLMPPDNLSGIGASMLAGMTGGGTGPTSGLGGLAGLAGFAGDFLGLKSSGALFVGILGSEAVQDRLISDFNLRRVYGASKIEDARDALFGNDVRATSRGTL